MTGPNELLVEYVNNLEKKQRNLIKRKAKLDTYRKLLQKGESLSSEQTKAVSDYESVSYSIIALKEVADGLSELQVKVECASKESEKLLTSKHEEFTLSALQNLVPVIEILSKIQSPVVKAAITKASSLQECKTLEMASKLIFMQFPPATESTVMADDMFKEPSLNMLKFGTCAPISIQSSKKSKSRASTFAAVRETCLNLLSDPTVRSALIAPYCEPAATNKKQSPCFSKKTKIAEQIPVQIPPPKTPEPMAPNFVANMPAEAILDRVINPLKTNFNFLQASHVDAPPVWEVEMESTVRQPINHSHMPNSVQQPEMRNQQDSQPQPHISQPMQHTHENLQHLEPQPAHQQTQNHQPQQQNQMQRTHVEHHQLHIELQEQPHPVHETSVESKPFVLHNSEEHQSEQFKPNKLTSNEVTGPESPRSLDKPTDLSAPKKKRNKKEKVAITTSIKPEQPQNEPTSLQAVMDEEVLLEAKPSQKMKSWAALCGGGNYPPVIAESPKPVMTNAPSQPEQSLKVEKNEKQHPPDHGREDFGRQPRGGFQGGRVRGNGLNFRGGRGRGIPRGSYQNGQHRNDFNNGHPAPIQSTC